MQLTIAKFYQVNGQSTQLRGLTSDIQLPSPEDLPLEGESTMDMRPLAYDESKPSPAPLSKSPDHPLPIAQLKALSASRIGGWRNSTRLSEDIERETKKDEVYLLSLNEAGAPRGNGRREKARAKATRPPNADSGSRPRKSSPSSRFRTLVGKRSLVLPL